eukprot:comp19063_c1_seq1/m.21532 comp19063_c1_seq1/g.21532  ORF comp19063_c1_seq1/g.21532 comp19063_c1_seq1/m.21532 type:complete len:116 (-) comp19063_c1_seq1:629-976(-)
MEQGSALVLTVSDVIEDLQSAAKDDCVFQHTLEPYSPVFTKRRTQMQKLSGESVGGRTTTSLSAGKESALAKAEQYRQLRKWLASAGDAVQEVERQTAELEQTIQELNAKLTFAT